jgi:hypothetical protein
MTKTEIALRELEIERNIFKCLSSRVSVRRNRTKAHAQSLHFDLRDPWVTALAGNKARQSSTVELRVLARPLGAHLSRIVAFEPRSRHRVFIGYC